MYCLIRRLGELQQCKGEETRQKIFSQLGGKIEFEFSRQVD